MGIDMLSLLVKGLKSSLYVGFLAGIILQLQVHFLGFMPGLKAVWLMIL